MLNRHWRRAVDVVRLVGLNMRHRREDRWHARRGRAVIDRLRALAGDGHQIRAQWQAQRNVLDRAKGRN